MKIKVMLGLSLVSMMVLAPMNVLAAPKEQEVTQAEQAVKDLMESFTSLKEEEMKSNNEVTNLLTEIETVNSQIVKDKKKLDSTKEDLTRTEKALKENTKYLAEMARNQQVNSGSKVGLVVDTLLSADSFSEGVNRVFAVSTLISAQNDRIEANHTLAKEQSKLVDVILESTEKLEERSTVLAETKEQLDRQKEDIQNRIVQNQSDVANGEDTLTKLQESLEQQIVEAESKNDTVMVNTLNSAKETVVQEKAQQNVVESGGSQLDTPSDTPISGNTESTVDSGNGGSTGGQPSPTPQVPTAPSGNSGSVIDIANQYLGVPYVWGGTSPSGFDCSGLTQYVFAQAGVSLGRNTVAQESAGHSISMSEVRAGDLLFWGSQGNTYHVAIALGGGSYIHAPTEGQSVSVGSSKWFTPQFARRVL